MNKQALHEMMQWNDTFTMQRLADVPEAQINLVCLAPKQEMPAHKANSNVRLMPLVGEITIVLDCQAGKLQQHEMAEVDYGTFMQISNQTTENAAFKVIKRKPQPLRQVADNTSAGSGSASGSVTGFPAARSDSSRIPRQQDCGPRHSSRGERRGFCAHACRCAPPQPRFRAE